jgi:16S rRNA G966 N2-methylase RsmD
MNIPFLLQEEVQAFIRKNEAAEPAALMLQAKRHPEWPMAEVVQQVQGLQKAREKLPVWHQTPGIIFPAPVSMEQCSSEQAARFKAGLVSGEVLADLSGGLGVDDWAFSKQFRKVIYLERRADLANVAAHNFKVLRADNIAVSATDAQEWLSQVKEPADVIYLDPARRGTRLERVLRLEDCEPRILDLLPELWKHTNQILLKTAPLLDITQAVKDLQQVAKVWAVAVNGEVKEVLYLLQPNADNTPEINAVDLRSTSDPLFFTTTTQEETDAEVEFTAPQRYLYEPNAAVLKIGAFRSVSVRFRLKKLHPSSHLYTSEHVIPNFPGRSFEILKNCRYHVKELKAALPEGKANLTVRNFPETVAQIRKKTGLREGGDTYLFATTDFQGKHIILICRKIS